MAQSFSTMRKEQVWLPSSKDTVKLIDDNPSYKGSGRLTKKMRQKLVSAARCAIRMRSKETDTREAVVKLNKDLLNGPSHCFGIHTHCSSDFCSVTQQSMQ